MSFEKKMKRKGRALISAYVDSPYSNVGEKARKPFPLWAKISIPSALGSAAIAAIVLALSIASFTPRGDLLGQHALLRPEKPFNSEHVELSLDYRGSIGLFANEAFKRKARSAKQSQQMTVNVRNEAGEDASQIDEINFVLAPFSYANTLYMLYDGSAGETKDALKQALHLDETSFDHRREAKNAIHNAAIDEVDSKNRRTYSDVSQALFVDDSIVSSLKQEYLDGVAEAYYASAFRGDLKSHEMLDVMNAYRAEKTQTTSGEVSHAMLDDLSSMAGGSLGTETMWLFNTSCVISEWGEETVLGLEADFENYDGSKTSGVRYFQMKRVCELLEGEQYYLATFPLQKELNFHVLLPKEGTDYSSVMEENADALFSLSAPLNYMANVSLTLPEFDISTTLSSLSDILAADSHLQTSETAQSYPGIVSSAAGNKFSIASFACSEIQVKSTGITASSAISGGYLFPLSGEWEGPRVHLRADHPFLFALTNSDGLPLYAGQLAKINQKDGI